MEILMIRLTKTFLASGLAATALIGAHAPALAEAASAAPIAAAAMTPAEKAEFEAERQIILSMAGDHKVTFDMQEGTPWLEGYEPLEPKKSGGYESVRVIEDTGTRIVLQHLLVVGSDESPYVVKHWRQDWEYEPEAILAYEGGDTWTMTEIPAEKRKGAWSQTVYQVDDSPRYAGIGTWEEHNGVTTWVSNPTTRPLARRDATRNPIYDRYESVNRHQLTPTGWIHWQDNTKMMPAKDDSGKLVPVVQEYVLNTYERFDEYNVAAADSYWEKTGPYWDAVRAKWDEVATTTGGIRVAQEANFGTDIAGELLKLADAIKDGETASDEATAKALALIETGTARSGG
jgi:hypothetical protein